MLFDLSCILRKIFRVWVILKLDSLLLIPGQLVKGALRLDSMVSWMNVALMSSQGSENQSLYDKQVSPTVSSHPCRGASAGL
jgi:hypothetical protein